MLRLARSNFPTRLIASGSALRLNRLPVRRVSQLQFQVPKPTLSQRVWYRKDGTPRSKKRGLIIGGVTAAILSLLYTMLDLLDEMQQACASLIFLVHVQRLDYEFTAKPMTEIDTSFAYFEALFRPFIENESDLDYVTQRFSDLDATSREAVHQLIQSLYDKLHAVLQKSAGNEAETAFTIQDIIEEVLFKMMEKLKAKEKSLKIRKERRPDKDDDYQIVG
ncbi:hypothetical protein C8J56DRAFT_37948 [Mycena floridula]|nr:hypothetical protein C8J56DRAFT_37948 [Mycena floridula]